MKKLFALPLVAAVACSGAFKDEARGAMPSKESISMGSPDSQQPSSTSGGAAITQNSTAGQQSPFWALTVGVAVVFNVPTAVFLDLLRHVVEDYDPTSCDASSCTWQGSGALDRVDYRLVVSRDGDGVSFDWSLSGAVKPGTTYVTFANGVATPGPQRHHGSGNFQIDFDKAATLGIAGDATGQMQVTSYTNVGPAQLDVTFLGAKDTDPSHPPGQKNNVVYSYKNDNSGGGNLDFAMHNTSSGDRFAVHSRWKNDGRGRADVTALPTGYTSISVSECWGAAPFDVVYFTSTEKAAIAFWAGPDSGSETQCAYTPADPSEMSAP